MSTYRNNVVVITGGASGIGLALAERFSKLGARIVLADLNADAVTRAADSLGCEGYAVDVRDADAVRALIEGARDRHGSIDLLFNNAGIGQTGLAESFDLQDWRDTIDINVYGVIHGVQAAYPIMLEQGSGHIINTASVAGLFPSPGHVPYVTSKHAVVGLSRSLRAEGASHGVKVTVVCPGIIATPMRRDLSIKGAASPDRILSMIPSGIPVERCVDRIMRGVRDNAHTVKITPLTYGLDALIRLSPSVALRLNRLFIDKLRARLAA